MSRHGRKRPGSWLGYLVGGSLGLGLVMAVEALVWMTRQEGRTGSQAFGHAMQSLGTADAWTATWMLVGVLVGMVAAGLAMRSVDPEDVGRAIATVVGVVFATILGVVLAFLTYAGVGAYLEGRPIGALLWASIAQAFEGHPAFLGLAGGGAFIGAAVAAYGFGNRVVARVAQTVTGTAVGALAGLVIYAIGYVSANQVTAPDTQSYLLLIGEAVVAVTPLEFFFIGLGATVGMAMGRYTWRFYGLMTIVALIAVVLGFLAYSFLVTLPQVDPGWKWLAVVLFVAETATLTMVVLYGFYTVDVATRKRWTKRPEDAEYSEHYLPKVAFQVPAFNEPPEMVIETLQKLLEVDYPRDRYVVMMLDDSTDEDKRRPVEEFCDEHDIIYLHREDRGGYKAGALNNSLEHTPDDVELFAIIDADYQVAPEYLKETVGYFVNPDLAWVQTPQDYRNRHQSFLTEQYYLADAYFYKTVMPSRNEENAIIFAGTMGIVRKRALEEVGGWGEEYISEDAELSVRLLNAGFDSLYINRSYGRGLIPPTYEGYKKQHYRWAFGGAKILRGHFWKLLFGRLSTRQRFDFFVGSAHWFEGIAIVLISWVLALLALGEIFQFRVATHHSQEILLVGLVPFFLLTDAITRLHMVMRKNMRLSFGQTLKVLGMWFAVKFSNAWGATKSFVGFTMPFVRTPKAPEERIGRADAFGRAVRATKFESFMVALFAPILLLLGAKLWYLWGTGGSGVLIRGFLWMWLFYYLLVFMAAPLYAYKSYVTFVPEEELPKQDAAPVGPWAA